MGKHNAFRRRRQKTSNRLGSQTVKNQLKQTYEEYDTDEETPSGETPPPPLPLANDDSYAAENMGPWASYPAELHRQQTAQNDQCEQICVLGGTVATVAACNAAGVDLLSPCMFIGAVTGAGVGAYTGKMITEIKDNRRSEPQPQIMRRGGATKKRKKKKKRKRKKTKKRKKRKKRKRKKTRKKR